MMYLTFHDVQKLASTINPDVLQAAAMLCAETDNHEYVRGVAELIIDTTHGITMDDKEMLMQFLVLPLDNRAGKA